MSHIPGIDVIDFVLLTIYPVAALFIVEMIFRITKFKNWRYTLKIAIIWIAREIMY